jgi:ketosteroid isomerase-like protein
MDTASPADVARAFYTAFSERDAEAMARLYHPQATFQDPVFGTLDAVRTAAMWRMLLGRAQDIQVSSVLLGVDGQTARVRWEARYAFSQTGRRVHNVVHARLNVQDGLIIRHTDRFNFWVWARQALGLPGLLLGWTPMLHRRVSRSALAGLKAAES